MDYEFHRRSIRMRGYDYAQMGIYYVTLCVEGMERLFGDIKEGEIILNDAGKMVADEWNSLTNWFNNIELDQYVIMPNHFHGIVVINGVTVGADLVSAHGGEGKHKVCPYPTLGNIIQAFKSITTVKYIRGVYDLGWLSVNKRLWQRNYYERIVRNERELEKFRNYIINNPLKWQDDEYYLSR